MISHTPEPPSHLPQSCYLITCPLAWTHRHPHGTPSSPQANVQPFHKSCTHPTGPPCHPLSHACSTSLKAANSVISFSRSVFLKLILLGSQRYLFTYSNMENIAMYCLLDEVKFSQMYKMKLNEQYWSFVLSLRVTKLSLGDLQV